jgi:tetratricopeptide (TPR) repeat protein
MSANSKSPQNSPSQPETPNSATTAPALSADAYIADAERRRQLERDLVVMGMTPDEIRRLLAADAHTAEAPKTTGTKPLDFTPPAAPKPAILNPLPARTPKKNANRVTAESLHSFAAELMTQRAVEQTHAIEEAGKELPPFRESTLQEKMQAEPLLREAHQLRRKERFKEAEAKCRAALALMPKDAPALEFLGDLLQGTGQVDAALAAYKRAVEADPKRAVAERKYGDLLVMQQNWNHADPEAVEQNPWVATLLSAMLPGAGQMFNGQWIKAIALTLMGLYYYRTFTHTPIPNGKIDWNTMTLLFIAGVVWIYAISDARSVSRQRPRR